MTPDVLVNGDTLTCWGFFADVVTGLGAISPTDLSNFKPYEGFAVEVVQPTDFASTMTESQYKPGYVEVEELLNHVQTLTAVNQWDPVISELDEAEIWSALVAGAMVGGAKRRPSLDASSALGLGREYQVTQTTATGISSTATSPYSSLATAPSNLTSRFTTRSKHRLQWLLPPAKQWNIAPAIGDLSSHLEATWDLRHWQHNREIVY